jgi:hypothetical protein
MLAGVTHCPVQCRGHTLSSTVLESHIVQYSAGVTHCPVQCRGHTLSSTVLGSHIVQYSAGVTHCPVQCWGHTLSSTVPGSHIVQYSAGVTHCPVQCWGHTLSSTVCHGGGRWPTSCGSRPVLYQSLLVVKLQPTYSTCLWFSCETCIICGSNAILVEVF